MNDEERDEVLAKIIDSLIVADFSAMMRLMIDNPDRELWNYVRLTVKVRDLLKKGGRP